jgi:hypothetical protein
MRHFPQNRQTGWPGFAGLSCGSPNMKPWIATMVAMGRVSARPTSDD